MCQRRFSASALNGMRRAVTFLNYVGQPLHYIIDAGENTASGKLEAALAKHPRNRFRKAQQRTRSMTALNLNVIWAWTIFMKLQYEAVITTANCPGDPVDSVGRVDGSVRILDEEGRMRREW